MDATRHDPAGQRPAGYFLDDQASRLVRRIQGSLQESMPLAMVVTDPARDDNPIIYVNDAFTEITGYPPEACLGRNCRFLQGEDRRQRGVARLRRAIDAREPVTVDLRNHRADGTTFLNRLLVSPLFDRHGRTYAFLGIQYEVDGQTEPSQQHEDA